MTAGDDYRIISLLVDQCARLVRAFVRQGCDVMARLTTKRVDPFYLSPAWRKLRAQVIAEQPVCASPYCGKPTKHVDHKESRRKRPDLALSRANTVGMCWGCHSRKTARQDGGFGNRRGAQPTGCDASGMPLGSGHHWARRP